MVPIKMIPALCLGCCVVHSSPSLFSYQAFSLPSSAAQVRGPGEAAQGDHYQGHGASSVRLRSVSHRAGVKSLLLILHPSFLLRMKRAEEGFSCFSQTSSAVLFHPIKPEPEQSKGSSLCSVEDDAKPICSSLLPIYCTFSFSVFTFLQLELLCQS